MCAAGLLPNLAALRARGRWGSVRSDTDRFPGAVWPSFFTMRDVSYHATYHFLQWDRERGRFRGPGRDWCPAPPFWEELVAAGTSVVTLDVPFARARPGAATASVLGWGTQEVLWRESDPPGLLATLERRFGRSSQSREVAAPRPEADYHRDLERHLRDVARRVDIIEYLASGYRWQILIACLSEMHYAGHWYWGSRATGEPQGGLRRVLRAFDAALPRLERLLDPDDHLALFSLHGMGERTDFDSYFDAIAAYLGPGVGGPSAGTALGRLRHLIPPSAQRLAVKALPISTYNALSARYANARDSARSRAVLTRGDDLLYVSANSAEPGAVLAAIRARLAELRVASGEPLVTRIEATSERYGGPRLSLLPDLVVRGGTPAGPAAVLLPDGRRVPVRTRSYQDGGHLPEGFYLQAGPGIAEAATGPDVSGQELAALLCEPAGIRPRPTL